MTKHVCSINPPYTPVCFIFKFLRSLSSFIDKVCQGTKQRKTWIKKKKNVPTIVEWSVETSKEEL